MTELKTLKDIGICCAQIVGGNETHIRMADLRTEGIKWVIHYLKLETKSKSKYDKHRARHYADALRIFCNITEEDLK